MARETSARDRVRRAYLQTLSREPTTKELDSALRFVKAAAASYEPAAPDEGPRGRKARRAKARKQAAQTAMPANARQAAWARLYHALLNSAEFRYRG